MAGLQYYTEIQSAPYYTYIIIDDNFYDKKISFKKDEPFLNHFERSFVFLCNTSPPDDANQITVINISLKTFQA